MSRAWLLALLLSVSPALAQDVPDPGQPRPERALVDEEFGVSTGQFGLRRQVEMAQWRQSGSDYALVWSESLIDSRGFPRERQNPVQFQLSSEEWETGVLMADGRPLDGDAVELLGEWRPLPPDPAALPPNLAATFQPDGDGLTSAADPAKPQAGDLRIRWFERVLPPLRGRIALDEGVWVAIGTPGEDLVDPFEPPPAAGEGTLRNYTPWLGALLLLIAGILVARHRRRRR